MQLSAFAALHIWRSCIKMPRASLHWSHIRRYLLRKTRIREIDVSRTAVGDRHLGQLCKANTTLVFLRYSPTGQTFMSQPHIRVQRILLQYPHVILFSEYTGCVVLPVVARYSSARARTHARTRTLFF